MLEEIKKVIIDGIEYDINDPDIREDYFKKGSYISLSKSDYFTYFVFDKFERNRFSTKIVKSMVNPRDIFHINIKTTLQNRVAINFYSFEEFRNFIDEYKLMYNENLDCYHFENEYELFTRVKPRSFDYIKYPKTIDYLRDYINLPERYEKSKEYKELLAFYKQLNISYGLDSQTYLETEGIRNTFGVEIETISGSFKDEEVSHLNLKAVHDGSLRDPDGSGPWGKEYVTGVLKGDAGFKHLQEITKTIASKCKIDHRASVHVHIGSLKWNSEEIVLAYLLGEILEEELFSMLPKSRSNNEYCKKLKPLSIRNKALLKIANDKKSYRRAIDKLYIEIFKEVSKINRPCRDYNKNSIHPKGVHGGYDRETDHRYKWLNFTNIIFNQRGRLEYKTIEFRNHSATLNYKKIRNWIKICMAFVEFVHNHKRSIIKREHNGEPITIKTILKAAYPKTADYLIDYVESRKELFKADSNESIDYTEEVNNDFNTKKELIRCV